MIWKILKKIHLTIYHLIPPSTIYNLTFVFPDSSSSSSNFNEMCCPIGRPFWRMRRDCETDNEMVDCETDNDEMVSWKWENHHLISQSTMSSHLPSLPSTSYHLFHLISFITSLSNHLRWYLMLVVQIDKFLCHVTLYIQKKWWNDDGKVVKYNDHQQNIFIFSFFFFLSIF